MKMYIRAMSMKRGDLKDWIEDHTYQVIFALGQLYLFPSGNRVHWRKEVWEKFSRMHTLKPTRKLPSSQFILDNSYGVFKNRMSSILQQVIDKEDEYTPISNIDDERFRLLVYDYFLWLSAYLSYSEFLTKADVLTELDRLGLTATYE